MMFEGLRPTSKVAGKQFQSSVPEKEQQPKLEGYEMRVVKGGPKRKSLCRIIIKSY